MWRLENVQVIGESGFFAGHCYRGFQATGSRVGGTVDFQFQCGGHNKGAAVFSWDSCHFASFVNFFDCWYEGPFVVPNCHFSGGSNSLGNRGAPYQVRFDVPPVIDGNVGRLDLNEG